MRRRALAIGVTGTAVAALALGVAAIAASAGPPERTVLERAAAEGRHWRIETANGPVHVWAPAGYHADGAATVLYVHGLYTTVDQAWDKHRLAEQFALSSMGAGAGGAVLTTPPDTLSDLHGDLSAIMRTSDERAAVIAASNGAGRWSSVITLISSEGRLRLYDDGFEWVGPEGVRRDEQRFSHRARGATDLAQTGARLTADGLQRLLSDSSPDPGPIPLAPVLVLCQTSLLSARTSNPESPESVRRMMIV